MWLLDRLKSRKRVASAVVANDPEGKLAAAQELFERAGEREARGRRGDGMALRISAQSFLLEILTSWPESEAAVRAWEWLDRTGVADRDDFVVRHLSPLGAAARNGDAGEVSLLLRDHAAELTKCSYNGYTPLHWAVASGDVETAFCLIEAGAALDAKAVGGWTALHIAADRNLLAMVELLLHRGANAEARLLVGATPLRLAARMGHSEAAQMLSKVFAIPIRARPSRAAASADDEEMVRKLVELATYYSAGGLSRDNPELVADVRKIGADLHERGGAAEMRRVFAFVPAMPGKRTVEMEWNGIGDWRG